MLRLMANDSGPPSGPLDQHGAAGLTPDKPNPARRTSRRYQHLRSIAENAELEAAFREIDTLGLMRLCIIRLAEMGSRKEADRIREELAHYLPEPLLDAMIRQATAVPPPPPKPARRKPTPRPSSDRLIRRAAADLARPRHPLTTPKRITSQPPHPTVPPGTNPPVQRPTVRPDRNRTGPLAMTSTPPAAETRLPPSRSTSGGAGDPTPT